VTGSLEASPDAPRAFPSLVHLLAAAEEADARRPAFTYVERGDEAVASRRLGELLGAARVVAARLQALTSPGDRVLVVFPHGLEFIEAFLGCLLAGVVAVPAVPPQDRRAAESWAAVARAARPSAILTPKSVAPLVEGARGPGILAPVLFLEDVLAAEALPWRLPALGKDSVAYLQFTSGSTGTPKGVVVTHGNLLHNCGLLREALDVVPAGPLVSWLPFFHDWGLLGCVVFPLFMGMPCYLMSPAEFLYAPARWLKAISRFRARISCAPNFAYEACCQRISESEKASFDLAGWQVAMVGAEPVRSETLERFTASFRACGFRPEAFHPSYGLAEASLIVSGGRRRGPPLALAVERRDLEARRVAPARAASGEGARTLVGCGHPLGDQRLRVVDAESRAPCGPGEVGEIWVSGDSVAAGYWEQAEETGRTFGARLDGEEGRFLRTGDLGFLWEGELFLCGRAKDVIIKAGNNYFAEDVERSAGRSHPSLRSGCGAAFAVEAEGAERLVIVHELEFGCRADPAVVGSIQKGVFADLGVLADAVVLLRPGSLPKTTSGKVRRQRARTLFLGEELDAVSSWRCW